MCVIYGGNLHLWPHLIGPEEAMLVFLVIAGAIPPIDKIHPFSNIAVTFEPECYFDALRDLGFPNKNCYIVHIMTESTIFNHKGVAAP